MNPPALISKSHNSVFPCLFLVPFMLSLHWKPGECLQVSLYAGTLRGHLGFQSPSVLSGQTKCLLIFTARCTGNSTFQHRTPGLRSLVWGLDPFLFQGNLCHWGVPPSVQPLSLDLGSAHFHISTPPTSLNVASSLSLVIGVLSASLR